MGLGDAVWLNGAVRYYSKMHETVYFPCHSHYENQIRLMFSDLTNLVLIPITSCSIPWFAFREAWLGNRSISAGYMTDRPHADYNLYPHCFYDDMQIPRDIRTKHFYIPTPPDSCVPPECPYVFIHEQSTAGVVDIFSRLQTNLLVIDPNKNHYDVDHPFHKVAETFLNKPGIVHYMDVIKNAEEIHGVDSSFLCLAAQLDLSKVKVKKCYWARSECIKNLGIFEIV